MKKINYYLAGLSGLIMLLPSHITAQPGASALRESIIKNERATAHNKSETTNTAASPVETKAITANTHDILYRVQILALKHPIDPKPLKVSGIDDKVYAIKGPEVTRYYMGEFHDLNAATKYKEQIVNAGFEDACVVAYKGDDRISIRQSLALEGEGK